MTDLWHRALGMAVGAPEVVILAGVVVVLLLVAALWLLVRRRRRGEPALHAATSAEVSSAEAASSAAIRRGLTKTRAGFLQRLLPLLGRDRLDPTAVEELETALLAADVGVQMTNRLLQSLRDPSADAGLTLRARLEREILGILEGAEAASSARRADDPGARPHVIMVVGVNGVGKTTSIGKLAAHYTRNGKRTLLVAADTFRAAAIEQLAIWAERSGAELVRQQHGGDPGAVAFDGIKAGVARGMDLVIVDTAGRLHTKSNLMDELRKVRRVIARELAGAPHETLLVVDSVTGQNGLMQARAFLEHLEITGVILTKLDGTARGGIVLAIAGELGLPIRFVGVGEAIEDLRRFEPREFAAALLSAGEPSDLP